MHKDEVKAIFNEQAAGYDKRWEKMAPIRNALHFLLESIFAELPVDARVLCVGVGTGAELVHLAQKNPGWRFTAVEPSEAMLDVCIQRAEAEGIASRCDFHEGYLESLAVGARYDAATCFLVSQFILNEQERSTFFRGIAERLKPGGILASSDLASEVNSRDYEALLHAWMNMMAGANISSEERERMRQAYAKDVAVLPAEKVASIVESGGFESSVQFFQAGLIHAWLSRRGTNAL